MTSPLLSTHAARDRNGDCQAGREIVSFHKSDLGYGRAVVLSGLDLTLRRGDRLGIVGPNGVGKTTILKAMLGIVKPLAGLVRRADDIRYGYVPQRQYIDEVFPVTAAEVAMMGRYPLLGPLARPSRKDRQFVNECLDMTGIADLAARPFRELSGGQKQRTLIARALAGEPDVMILDEPTNDMDVGSEHAIMELLKVLHGERGITTVMVSHLLGVVVNYAETLVLIGREARLVGRTSDILASGALSQVYGVPVQAERVRGRWVVVTGGADV